MKIFQHHTIRDYKQIDIAVYRIRALHKRTVEHSEYNPLSKGLQGLVDRLHQGHNLAHDTDQFVVHGTDGIRYAMTPSSRQAYRGES